MPHDGNLRVQERLHQPGALAASFDLDRRGPPFLQEPAGVFDRIAPPGLERQVGHVPDHQGVTGRSRDRARMVEHLLHGHRQGALIAEHVVPQAVADQEDVDP